MTEQWQELKETITEMRDNDGTGTQQDVCKFLVDYMEVLEKQMQQPCEDAVSREAVIKNIKGWFDKIELNPDILIDSIVTLPSVTPRINLALTSQDCISREEVQDLISRWLSDYLLDETREALETINYKVGDMPSVTPQRPKGKWIEDTQTGFKIRCSECGARNFGADRAYCPRCGRQMGGADETN